MQSDYMHESVLDQNSVGRVNNMTNLQRLSGEWFVYFSIMW